MKFKSGRKFLEVTFLVMLGWLVALILPPSAQAAGPWYVSNSGDDTKNCTSDLTACASINAVLNKPGFVPGDTVLVATGIYTGTGNEVVFINKGVTVSGGWDNTFLTQSGMSTIDGETVRQGIIISGSISVTLNRLVIQNGFGSESGGGIFNNGGDLTIRDSSLIKNQGSSSGGGLYQISGTLDMSKTLITQNSSGSDGAGIYDSGNIMNITDSIISENTSAYGYGGGVANYFGTLVINNTTISNNIQTRGFGSFHGTGIYNVGGTLVLNNSTISGNSGGYGEGIYSFAGGAVYLNNSTISNNQVYGLTAYYSPVTIQNSIIAHNGQVDCFDETIYNTVSIQSLGYNLVENNQNCVLGATDLTNVDPLLGSLENNGGSTPTHALLQGSPALDAGNPNGCTGDNGPLTTDQRGMPRVGRCDIGAFEEQNPFSAIMTVNRTIAAPAQILHYEIIPWREGVNGLANILITNTLPVSITFLNNSLSATKGTVGYSNGTVTWNGSINANEAITISYDALVNLSTPVGNSINNTASINGGTVFTRTTATSIVSHFKSAKKSVDKAEALRGDPLQFAIDFTGNSLLEATNVLVTDTLPTQLSYIPNSLTASSGNASFTAGTIRWNGTVNPGETVTILFRATVSPTAPLGTPIVNSAVINGGGEIITRTSSTSISTLAFLPFVSYTVPCVGICGYVTENGARVPGVSLQLRFYNGSTWSTVMSTLTGADGSYSFTTAAGLGSGQEYYVLYQNSSTNTRLSSWSTRILTSYTAGTSVAIGNFDIANIPLVSPPPDAIVSLPYTFQWTRRPATTSDSYEFDLFDLGNSNISAWTSPLGYVASYTLNGLPSQFYKGVWYGWYVAVYSPDGGYGTSYYYRRVAFLNSGSGPLSRIPSKAQPVRDSWQGKLPVQLESK